MSDSANPNTAPVEDTSTENGSVDTTPVENNAPVAEKPKSIIVNNLKDYGSFEHYTPEPGNYPNGYENAPSNFIFDRNELGQDFYNIIYALGTPKTNRTYVYVRLPEMNVIQAINDDSDAVPPKRTLLGSPVVGFPVKVLSFDLVTEELTGAIWDGANEFTLSDNLFGFGAPVVETPPAEPAAPTFPKISKRQFAQGLWELKVFTYEQSDQFISNNVIPPALQDILDSLPDDETGDPTPRKLATFLLKGATEYSRDNPLVELVRQQQDPEMSVEDFNDYWNYWATL